jgi:hypothetical protein
LREWYGRDERGGGEDIKEYSWYGFLTVYHSQMRNEAIQTPKIHSPNPQPCTRKV